MGPTNLDDVVEGFGLCVERPMQVLESRQEMVDDVLGGRDVHGRRIVSFEDWLILTWSLGCTGFFDPISPPSISIARLEITSLAFMFDCVPEPVCQTTSGKWPSELSVDHLLRGSDDRFRSFGSVCQAQGSPGRLPA